MGISKSIKNIFGKTKKKKDDVASIGGVTSGGVATHSDVVKSPKTKPKNRNRIKPNQLSGQIPTKSCLKMNDGRLENGRVPYGAYNQANAKLVTADGDYPSNYEHYSNFEPKKPTGIAHSRNPGILKGANIDENGTTSIPGGLCQSQKISLANQSLRGSKLNISDSCSDFGGSVISSSMSNYEFYQPMGAPHGGRYPQVGAGGRAPVRASSVTDIHSLYSALPAKFGAGNPIQRRPSNVGQGQPMLPQPPAQPNMNYQQWNPYMQYQGGLTRSPSMSSIMSAAQPDSQSELAVAMQKMEHCMALLNSLQCQNPNMVLPNMQSLMGSNMGPVPAMGNMGPINCPPNRNMGPMPGGHVPIIRRPSHNLGAPLSQLQRSRTSLQPQPEFQERELRKKRRLRKKSDLSKFDMSDLKKKLESITHEESTSSDDSSKSSSSNPKSVGSDAGFYEASTTGSGSTTPEKEKSDDDSRKSDSGDDSSDSGVQTPPLLSDSTGSLCNTDNDVIEVSDDVTKTKAKIKDVQKQEKMSEKETDLLSSLNLLRGRTRTKSE